jgi:hypothetical protein
MSQPQSYPEHEKFDKIQDKSRTIGEFLDWLFSVKHCVIAQFDSKDRLTELPRGEHGVAEEISAEFFGIDLKKLYLEKQEMHNKAYALAQQ